MSKIMAFVVLFAFAPLANAQIKIEGPKEATTGYRVKAKLTLDVTDPQIKCFPANDDWYAVQDLSGAKYIDFVPGKKSVPAGQSQQLYTFVIAGNKGNKTFLETYELVVKPDGDVPVPPGPTPVPPVPPGPAPTTELYKAMLAQYKTFPSATGLAYHKAKYAEFLKEVQDGKYNSASGAGQGLAAKFSTTTDLKGVREVVTDYLQKNAGNTWNKEKVITAMTEIVKTINAIPE